MSVLLDRAKESADNFRTTVAAFRKEQLFSECQRIAADRLIGRTTK